MSIRKGRPKSLQGKAEKSDKNPGAISRFNRAYFVNKALTFKLKKQNRYSMFKSPGDRKWNGKEKNELKSEKNLQLQLKYLLEKHNIKFIGKATNCRFHDDETPSMLYRVNNSGAVKFHCFSCEFDMDIYEFIGKLDGCTFPEALSRFKSFCNGTGGNGNK